MTFSCSFQLCDSEENILVILEFYFLYLKSFLSAGRISELSVSNESYELIFRVMMAHWQAVMCFFFLLFTLHARLFTHGFIFGAGRLDASHGECRQNHYDGWCVGLRTDGSMQDHSERGYRMVCSHLSGQS